MKRMFSMLLASVALAACSDAPAEEEPAATPVAEAATPDPNSPEGKIASAMSAAPTVIASGATIMDMGADMSLTELRAGTNGWTCFPNLPSTPGPDPMCLDPQGLAWAQAWMAHTPPKLTTDGLAYMLQGGSDPTNDDPFAEAPPTGADWVTTPPHVMILPVNPSTLDNMSNDPSTGQPFVMFRGTPYAHVMMPVADMP